MHKWIILLAATALLVSCRSESAGPEGGAAFEFAIPAVIAEVKREDLIERINLVATLKANERVDVTAEIDGLIASIDFQEGQAVTQEQLLFTLDQDKPATELDAATAEFKLAELELGRGKQLLSKRIINQQDFDEIEAKYLAEKARMQKAVEDLEDTQILAPFDGMVTSRDVSRGQYITRGQKLTEIVDLHQLKLECFAPERYAGRLTQGMRVTFETVAYPGRRFQGEVYFVSPQVDVTNRTILIKAIIDNPEGLLKPGMFGNLDLEIAVYPDSLTIPEAGVSFSQSGARVMTVDEEGRAEIRAVELGIRMEGRVQAISGLKEGERVVVEGHQKLQPGAKVQAVGDEGVAEQPNEGTP